MTDRLREWLRGLTSEQRRTLVLGGVAAGMIALFVLQELIPRGEGAGGVAVGTPDTAPAAAPAPGAPEGLDQGSLQKRYAPVLDAGLFTVRSFRERPRASPRPERRERPTRSEPPPPSMISLRLTGLLGTGEARHGVLEEGGTGRGLIAKGGRAFGETSVAEVQTSTLVVVEAGKKRVLSLGETLALPVSFKSELKQLRPPTPKGLVQKKSYSSSSAPRIELSDEKKMSILERLKAARQSSMNKKEADDGQE